VSVALATTGVRDPRPGPGADRLETDVVAVEPGFLDPEHGERELSAIVSLWQSSPGGPLGKGARVASPARSCPPPASQSSLTVRRSPCRTGKAAANHSHGHGCFVSHKLVSEMNHLTLD
jgi:hypothetical protein